MEQQDLEPRIAELMLISSMYPNQIKCLDPNIQKSLDNGDFINKISTDQKSINVIFQVDQSLEVDIVLPIEQKKKIQVHCRLIDPSFNRPLQKHLNDQVENFTGTGLIEIIPKIIEIWDNLEKVSKIEKEKKDETDNCNEENNRIWIYSHHIYSSEKRKMIVDLCKKLNLNGFMLIGKPGFICVEGEKTNCEEFWSSIRAWNWQRITIIETEVQQHEHESFFIFESFEEHVDRSTIFRHLESKNCDKTIKNFLGIRK